MRAFASPRRDAAHARRHEIRRRLVNATGETGGLSLYWDRRSALLDRSNLILGALLISRELSLAGPVGPDTRRPPTL